MAPKISICHIEGLDSDSEGESTKGETITEEYEEEIQSFESDDQKLSRLLEIPDNTNLCCLAGTTLSGKSVALIHILKNKINYKFDDIILFCSSSQQMLYSGFPESSIKEPSIESIEFEVERQTQIFQRSRKTCLFIFDDLIGEVSMSHCPIIDKLSVSGRHQGITTLILLQDMAKISQTIKQNLRICWVTTLKSNSLDALSRIQLGMDPKKFVNMMKLTFKQRYSIKRIDCMVYNEKIPVFSLPDIKHRVRFII